MLEILRKKLIELKESNAVALADLRRGNALYIQGNCQMLSQSGFFSEVLIENGEENVVARIVLEDNRLQYSLDGKAKEWDSYGIASLLQVIEEYEQSEPHQIAEGRAYTREGMIKRVVDERREKASKSNYRITFADNVYGEHTLINERGQKYKITLRDFENETGYIDNPDLKTNKLGTTKHIIYAFRMLKSQPELMHSLDQKYPFVEIYLDPLNDYRITWHYPHTLAPEIEPLIRLYFGDSKTIADENIKDFLLFIGEAANHPSIVIRPEVDEKVKKAWDREMLDLVQQETQLDFSLLKVKLFPYQEEGVRFATYKEGAIIADEMGLGKTIQAIGTAVMKKSLLGFRKTLIVCPASLKEQWKQEIEKFCHEQAVIAEGFPEQRAEVYRNSSAFFVIINYETVLRDLIEINRMEPDFIILDEAQRIKNFTTITAKSIKQLKRKHALVITGTPIENRLIDLYSVVDFIDPHFLAPLWEFSYQHCYFDVNTQSKITGYYNLQQLNERLKPILIRREKRKVIKELPNITEMMVPLPLSMDQAAYHADFAAGIGQILNKKYISPYDQQLLMLLLNNMRMVCDSTFLIDKETNVSPKLHELEHILLEKLDVRNKEAKIIIFSEWVTMLHLISQMLKKIGIGHVMLSGKVAVKNRDKLVKKFESDPHCKVFLSSEAGGAGLNLQVADTVINFELPWNPAKKNQRIGRIDRLGQLSKHLTVINLITKDSIEMRIASGLTLKENLFEGVLNEGSGMDVVDFSASGRSQFLQQLEEAMNELMLMPQEEFVEPEEEPEIQETVESIVEEEAHSQEEISKIEKPMKPAGEEVENMERVMTSGLEFLSGMLKMATGKDLGLEGQKVEVNKETGEVVMRFKLPGF